MSKSFGSQSGQTPHLAGKGEVGDLRADVEAALLVLEARTGFPAINKITGAGAGLSLAGIPAAKAIVGTDLDQGKAHDTYTTADAGTSSLVFAANRPGTSGLTIALVDAAAFSVSVTGQAVTVNYRGPANGNADKANTIAAGLAAHATAKKLLTATAGGAGNVTPLAAAPLTGGKGSGLSVKIGGVEQDIVGVSSDTSIPMVTSAFTGLAAGDLAMLEVTSNGVKTQMTVQIIT